MLLVSLNYIVIAENLRHLLQVNCFQDVSMKIFSIISSRSAITKSVAEYSYLAPTNLRNSLD